MAFRERQNSSSTSSPVQQAAPTLIASRLLPEVFGGFEPGDPITVLDLGAGNTSTLEFLSQYRAKIYFADLLDNPAIRNPPEATDTATLAGFIQRQLGLAQDTQIDVCLFWDYLHYIDLAMVEALSLVLQTKLSSRCVGYGFGALHGKRPSDANSYGIADIDTLAARPLSREPTYFAHSQQRLNERFGVLKITRGTLLREGRLELLFCL